MIKRSIAQIVEMLQVSDPSVRIEHSDYLHVVGSDSFIHGVSTDTRNIEDGNLFVPLIGNRFNGHDYVEGALKNGAKASLWQADQPSPPNIGPLIIVRDTLVALQSLAAAYRQELSLKVIAVTGSNGKTTTKDIIAELLNSTFRVFKTPGNLNNHIGLPLTLLQCSAQTEVLVVEMGMSGRGEISLLSRLARPDIAVITMIGEAHLEQLGSREAIAEAKLEIVDGLASSGCLFYNGDEPLLQARISSLAERMQLISFGQSSTNQYYPSNVQLESDGATFCLNERLTPVFYSPLLGYHNVLNSLIGLAIGERLGIHPSAMQEPLARLKITGMRGERLVTAQGTVILNDAYNASPASMRAALEMLATMRGFSRKIVVLGDMLELGEQSTDYHKRIGDLLDPQVIAQVFTFGAQAAHIARQAAVRFPQGTVIADLDKHEIAKAIATVADQQTVVLVKGSRGMKLEEVVQQICAEI